MAAPDFSEIPIVFNHRDFIIINKPAGLSVHQEKDAPGVVPLVQQQEGIEKLWLVHRLDKVTSGCLILAKNAETAAQFGRHFEQKEIQKYYLALTDKKPKKRQGSIIGDLKKVRDGKWILSRDKLNPSVTHFFDRGFEQGLRLQILKPYTGQTHQLRVVMSSLGASILGDEHYNGTAADRTYLHAWQLHFTLQDQQFKIACLPQTGAHFLSTRLEATLSDLSEPDAAFHWPDGKLKKVAGKDVT